MKPAVGPLTLLLSKVKVCADGLKYNMEYDVSLMHTVTIVR